MAVDAGLLFGLVSRFGYALLFLLGVGEALPLVGIVIPGHATLLLAGVAAAAGLLDIRGVIAVAFVAGVVGDALGFWISRRWGRALLARYGSRVRIRPEHVAKVDEVFEKHGPWALVLVRFSFIARGLGPFFAGLSTMRWRTFWIYNVVGAALWSVANALGGYFFGLSFLAIEGRVGRILAYTLLAVLGVYLLYRVLRRYAPAFTRVDFAVAMLGVGAGAVFGVVADRVADLGLANPLDAQAPAIARAFASVAPLARAIELATHAAVLGALALLVLAILLARRRKWEAVLVALGVGGIIALVALLQPVFAGVPQGVGAAEFPSTRAAVSVALVGVATYLVAERSRRAAPAVATAAAGLLLVVAASGARMAQGAEYPTSVVAGVALGVAWFSVSLLLVEYGIKRPRKHQDPTDS